MKTRDRILDLSLRLFNEEGEAHTTTIDIANELDISPGNLYYHFKGKDQIIAELFEQFQLALGQTLNAPLEQPLHTRKGRVEDNWYFLYVVLEELYQYRFLYHNLDDLLRRYPKLVRGFRRIVGHKRAALRAIIDSLLEQSLINLPSTQMDALVENMALQLTYWLNYDRLLHDERDAERCIHQGVLQLLTMVMPYLGDDQIDFYRECETIFEGMLQLRSSS
ncbi:MAG: TetR/AcrR family transcriptional regulator [Congregibacter sp.]